MRLGAKFVLTFLGPDTRGALRGEMEDVLGCDVYDNYGTNEMGGGAFECRYKNGLHFSEDCMYFEIVDTETGEPMPDGESGNLVVTVFYRALPPIVRFNLRDLGRILHTDTCECGSNFRRMDHFLGRSDDMVKLRGVNLNPMACLNAVTSDERTTGEWVCIAETVERRGVRRDEMTVQDRGAQRRRLGRRAQGAYGGSAEGRSRARGHGRAGPAREPRRDRQRGRPRRQGEAPGRPQAGLPELDRDRPMALSETQQIAMWEEVLRLCNVHDGETVVVLTKPEARPENVKAARNACIAIGAKTIHMEPHIGGARLRENEVAMDAMRAADMVIDLVGLHLLRGGELPHIRAADTRILYVTEPPEALARMMPREDDKRRVHAAGRRIEAAKTMRVESDAGTNFECELGEYPVLYEYGYSDDPGHWDHWPAGFVATWPNEGSARGTIVVDRGGHRLSLQVLRADADPDRHRGRFRHPHIGRFRRRLHAGVHREL